MDKLPRRVLATITSGITTSDLGTIPDIELLEVGEDWDTSTGLFTWEPEDLLAAIASQEDPSVRSPIVKLGHEDFRFNPVEGPKSLGGQPAFGRIANLRVVNNGNTLMGDFLGVPRWLIDVMPTAYPRRSIEGYFNYTSRTGNTWPFVLTACALLGTKYPAINTLEDLKILWGGTPPPMVEVVEDEEEVETPVSAEGLVVARKVEPVAKVKSGKVPGLREVKAAQEVKATTTTSDIQREWYAQLESGQMWWWIRQVLVNPLQLVVDDDEGGLYLVDVSVDASDNVTYSEPQPVKIEYVAASEGNSGLAAVHEESQIVAASYEDASASGRPEVEAGGEPSKGTPKDKRLKGNKAKVTKAAADGGEDDDEEEESGMGKLSDDAIRRLGLDPAKATDDEINAAILAQVKANTDADGDTDADDDADDDTDDSTDTDADSDADSDADTDTDADTTSTTTSTIPDGVVMVDKAQWDEVTQEVAASRADRKTRTAKERSEYLAAAVKAGKFPRARLGHYEKLMASDPKGTKILIDGLEPGLIPVKEVGTGAEEAPEAAAAYPDSWRRDRRVVAQRQSVSTRVKVVND